MRQLCHQPLTVAPNVEKRTSSSTTCATNAKPSDMAANSSRRLRSVMTALDKRVPRQPRDLVSVICSRCQQGASGFRPVVRVHRVGLSHLLACLSAVPHSELCVGSRCRGEAASWRQSCRATGISISTPMIASSPGTSDHGASCEPRETFSQSAGCTAAGGSTLSTGKSLTPPPRSSGSAPLGIAFASLTRWRITRRSA
jgi:hypothetical protein